MGITKAKKNCLKFWSVNIMNISLIALKRHSRNLQICLFTGSQKL